MNFSKQKTVVVLLAVASLVLPVSSALASPENSPSEFEIDAKFQRYVRIVGVSAQQNESGLVISGEVKRVSRSNRGRIPKGYVGATLYNSEGTVLYKGTASYFPRMIPRTGKMKSSFQASIPVEPPSGSVVRLDYRYSPNS